jgi:hypothetical protein
MNKYKRMISLDDKMAAEQKAGDLTAVQNC